MNKCQCEYLFYNNFLFRNTNAYGAANAKKSYRGKQGVGRERVV